MTWIKATNKDRTVYGEVYGSTFYKWKWKTIPREPNMKLPRICAKEVVTVHEIKEDFWSKFEVISNSEWNECWAKDYISA